MICLVSLEHQSWLDDPDRRHAHLAYCMDVQLRVEALTNHPCLVQRYPVVTRRRLQALGVKVLILSGNAADWSVYDPAELAELCDLIRDAERPILGLCGGHQLIAMAHGAPVGHMRLLQPGEPDVRGPDGRVPSAPGYLKEWGFMPVSVVRPDPLFDGLGASPLFLEVHHCEVKALPAGFDLLAASQECPIQAMKRVDRLVYGVQFHPEGYTERPADRSSPLVDLVYPDGCRAAQPDGRHLLANFFRVAGVLNLGGRASSSRPPDVKTKK
jgi:GMP synthase (glutamine-hydrolysing)